MFYVEFLVTCAVVIVKGVGALLLKSFSINNERHDFLLYCIYCVLNFYLCYLRSIF